MNVKSFGIRNLIKIRPPHCVSYLLFFNSGSDKLAFSMIMGTLFGNFLKSFSDSFCRSTGMIEKKTYQQKVVA
jgi:hypothetical protein